MLAEGTLDELRALSGEERLSAIFLTLVERVEGREEIEAEMLHPELPGPLPKITSE